MWNGSEQRPQPDIVSAYSPSTGITLATEACQEKSNEIKAVQLLIDKIDVADRLLTADALSMQKDIIDIIRKKDGYFLIELKANQRALCYGVEDSIKHATPRFSCTEGPELEHRRIETRTYNVYDGLELIADTDKWGGNLTVVEFIARWRQEINWHGNHRVKAVCVKPPRQYSLDWKGATKSLVHGEHALGS